MCNHATVIKEINPYLLTWRKLQNILVRANESHRLKNTENISSTQQHVNLLSECFLPQEQLEGKSVSYYGSSKGRFASFPFLTPGIFSRNFLMGTFHLKGAVSRRGTACHCVVLVLICCHSHSHGHRWNVQLHPHSFTVAGGKLCNALNALLDSFCPTPKPCHGLALPATFASPTSLIPPGLSRPFGCLHLSDTDCLIAPALWVPSSLGNLQ